MARRSWFGYHPGAVAALRQSRQSMFEIQLEVIEREETALREQVTRLREEDRAQLRELEQVERAEEAVRTALTGALDREGAALRALVETHEQTESEAQARIAALQQERKRIARIEAALIEAVQGALTTYVLHEEEAP